MISKCLDFTSTALRRWGSELAMIIVVCFLISLLAPAINLTIWGNDSFRTIKRAENNSSHSVTLKESSPLTEAFKTVFEGTYLFNKILETVESFDYEGGIYFQKKLDNDISLVLLFIGRWILAGLTWFLLILPYILAGLVNVFMSDSDEDSALATFFKIKLSQYIRMIGIMLLISIRTLISAVFLFVIVYIISVIIFGGLEIWLLLTVGFYTLIYRGARFMLAPFYVMKTDFSPGRCLVLSWNNSAKYFWALLMFSFFPLGFGILPILLYGFHFSGAQIIFSLAITFSVILTTPIAQKFLNQVNN